MKKRDDVWWNGKKVTNLVVKRALVIAMTPVILTLDVLLWVPDKILKRCGKRGFFSKEYDEKTGEETTVTDITCDAFKKGAAK